MTPDPMSSLLAARSHEESRQIVTAYPVLLEPGMDAVLGLALAAARADGQLSRVHAAERVRLLLRRCREVGIAAAFDELTGQAMARFMDLLAQVRVPLHSIDSPGQLNRHIDACLQLVHHPGTAVADPPLRSAVFVNAAAAVRHRFDRLGQLDDLHRAVELALAAANLAPAGSLEERTALTLRGQLLVSRYGRTGEQADLEDAIAEHSRRLQAAIDDHSRADAACDLARTLRERHTHRGDLADLHAAVHTCVTALGVVTAPTERSRLYDDLARALLSRYVATGDEAAVARSVEAFEHAVQALHRDEVPPVLRLNLARARQLRWEATGRDTGLESAVDSLAEAVLSRPDAAPADPLLLSSLAVLLTQRFERLRDEAALRLAIDLHRTAVAGDESAVSPRANRLNELAATLYTSFRVTANPEQLDAAVNAGKEALRAPRLSRADEALYLSNLGASLQTRWVVRGSVADLDNAVDALARSVQATPTMHPGAADRLENLANALVSRATEAGTVERQLDQLGQAITQLEQALAMRPAESVKRATTMLNLGGALRRRVELTGRANDLDRALALHQAALCDIDADSPIRHLLLCDLAADHLMRFTQRWELGDCAEAIGCYQLALAQMTSAVDRPRTLHHLGVAHWARHLVTGASRDAETAMRYSRAAAVEGLDLHPEVSLAAGFTAGHFASEQSRFADAAEAFSLALGAAEFLVRLQLLRPHKERWLTATGVSRPGQGMRWLRPTIRWPRPSRSNGAVRCCSPRPSTSISGCGRWPHPATAGSSSDSGRPATGWPSSGRSTSPTTA
jgi:tetratricopeptide (TPR) repeat protein